MSRRPTDSSGTPKTSRYQAPRVSGSLLTTKMPPIPVIRPVTITPNGLPCRHQVTFCRRDVASPRPGGNEKRKRPRRISAFSGRGRRGSLPPPGCWQRARHRGAGWRHRRDRPLPSPSSARGRWRLGRASARSLRHPCAIEKGQRRPNIVRNLDDQRSLVGRSAERDGNDVQARRSESRFQCSPIAPVAHAVRARRTRRRRTGPFLSV